jgi:hypothetical protein
LGSFTGVPTHLLPMLPLGLAGVQHRQFLL